MILNKMPSYDEARKIYNYLKNNKPILESANELEVTNDELFGLIEILNYYDFPISIIEENNNYIIKKSRKKTSPTHIITKPSIEDTNKITLGVVSDTHLCSKEQQLHMLNQAYKNFYKNEISTVLHIGDLVDGDYSQKRKLQTYTRFMNGSKEQSDYVVEMYPKVNGITTNFIQGSHDETHKINGGAILGEIIERDRKDMIYLGQDWHDIIIDNVRIRLRHPGGGISKYRSRSIQHTIDSMATGNKPNLLLEGHYHKSYYFIYRNVHGILVPSLCYQSQFMERKDISNIMGYYIVDIYADEKGNIQYLTPKEHLFNDSEIKKDDWRKTRKLVI